MSEQVLNCADVVSVLQQVRREAVAQRVKADEGLAPMHVCLLGAPAVMQVSNPFAHLIQQPRRTQGRHRIGRDGPQCCARLRRTRVSLWHRIVLTAARQLPTLCAADRAGTVSVTAAVTCPLLPYQVVRATQDVDFLLEAEAADRVHDALLDLGYQCLYRSEDAANYVRAAEGLDLLYAHRPLARRLLAQASERQTPMGRMRIVSVEGLIGFKLQGFVNDATRTRDLDDIRALLKIHRASLDMDELREYFAMFNKPELLDELLG
jgi:hypothetical protein